MTLPRRTAAVLGAIALVAGLGAAGPQLLEQGAEVRLAAGGESLTGELQPAITEVRPNGLRGDWSRTTAARSARRTALDVDRPNVLLITTDDQTDGEMRWMPRTREALADAGVEFTDAISPHPLCCPARAELLTGEWAHTNGVRHNSGPYGGWPAFAVRHSGENLGTWLQEAGYRTGLVGKVLNGFQQYAVRPDGWDVFTPARHRSYAYTRTEFVHQGQPKILRTPGGGSYVADVVADQAVRMVEEWAGEPWFVWTSHVAPHASRRQGRWQDPVPARRFRDDYRRALSPSVVKPSYAVVPDDVPAALAGAAARDAARLPKMPETFRNRIRSLAAVDQANARIIESLRRTGQLDDTLILFTSDNGLLLGEHGLKAKDLPFEEALQVPLLARGPGLPAGEQVSRTVTTVDVTATVLDAAGVLDQVRGRGRTDGASLLDVAASEEERTAPMTTLIQGGTADPDILAAGGWRWRGVRTDRWTYAQWWTGEAMLYDRLEDPFQLDNLLDAEGRPEDPRHLTVLNELQRRFRELADCRGVGECVRSEPDVLFAG